MNKTFTSLFTCLAFSLAGQNAQVFTSSGSFTVPPGINSLTIEVVGAGGNGGGNGGGGGGGGGYAKGVYNVVPGTVYNIAVGIPGSGPAAGTTSVSNLIQATGGANGTSVQNPNVGGGGAGGIGSGGTIVNNSGGNGGGGYWTYFGGGGGGAAGPSGNGGNGGNTIVYTPGNCLTPGGAGGLSGGAPSGNGGKGAGFVDNFCNNANPAAAGFTYGGGGGGGNGNSSPAQPGAGGYCRIEYGACSAPPAPALTSTGSALMVCSGSQATLTASGTGTLSWHASPSGTASLGTGSVFVTPSLTANSTFYIQDNACAQSASRTAVTVSVMPAPVLSVVSSSSVFCVNQPFSLAATGASTYTWSNNNNGSQLVYTSSNAGMFVFTVTGTGNNGCMGAASISVSVQANPSLTMIAVPVSGNMFFCVNELVTFSVSGASSYSWSTGVTTATAMLVMPSTAVMQVTGTAVSGCSATTALTINAAPQPSVNIVAGLSGLCPGQSSTLVASGATTYTWLPGTVSPSLVVSPASTSTFTVAGTNVYGCRDTTSFGVTVYTPPQLVVSANPSLICTGSKATLSVSGASSYSWSSGGQNQTVTVSPLAFTVYTVTGSDSNSCSATAMISVSVSACTGISDLEAGSFQVYPNPSDGHFIIRSEKKETFFVTDLSGKQLGVIARDGNQEQKTDLSHLAPGIYFLRSSGGYARPLIIQR